MRKDIGFHQVILFWYLLCFGHGFKKFQSLKLPRLHSLCAIPRVPDDFIDISPSKDQGVLKKVLRRGDGSKGYPMNIDDVIVGWKFFLPDGKLMHSSEWLPEPFKFRIGAQPIQAIEAWEIAVKTMFVGELALLRIEPKYGFGINGSEPVIPKNTVLTCELELVELFPSIFRTYDTIGENETIQNHITEDIEQNLSPLTNNIMDPKAYLSPERDDFKVNIATDGQIIEPLPPVGTKLFDPSKHGIDPAQRVTGKDKTWVWDENPISIDVEIMLPYNCTSKEDLFVELKPSYCKIFVKSNNQTILDGPWFGKVDVSESSWAILNPDYNAWYKGPRLHLSLQKTYAYQDIWASVFKQSAQNTAI